MPAWEILTFLWWGTGYPGVTQQEIWWVQSWFIFILVNFSGLAQHFQEGSRVTTYVGPSLCASVILPVWQVGTEPIQWVVPTETARFRALVLLLRHVARKRCEPVYVGYVVQSCKSFCACHWCQEDIGFRFVRGTIPKSSMLLPRPLWKCSVWCLPSVYLHRNFKDSSRLGIFFAL